MTRMCWIQHWQKYLPKGIYPEILIESKRGNSKNVKLVSDKHFTMQNTSAHITQLTILKYFKSGI